jgi:hypothetical protein
MEGDEPVARELAPAGLRSRPLLSNLMKSQGRFAPQREQAPSPQEMSEVSYFVVNFKTTLCV